MASDNVPSRVMSRDKNYKKIAQIFSIYKYDYYYRDVELFRKQLNDDFEINYKVDTYIFDKHIEDSTILQIIEYELEFSQILIDHGADYTVVNKEGSTSLLKHVKSKAPNRCTDLSNYSDYLERLKLKNFKGKSYADVVLCAHVKSGNAKNPRDQYGLSHFHVACMYNHTDGVSFFLKNGVCVNNTVNQDSKFYPGYSALHFAAKSCALESAELLLNSGADMFAEDSRGMNPLHVLVVERIKTFITLRRLSRITPSNQNELHYSNLQNHYVRNQKMLALCLERICTFYPDILDKTTFFLIQSMCNLEYMKMEQLIDSNIENFAQLVNSGSQALCGSTLVHFAALFSAEIFKLLMQNGANLAIKNFNKVTPFDICLKGFNIVDLHKIISLHQGYSKIVFSNKKIKLSDFIYAMREVATFEKFLKDNLTNANMFIPFDSPVCAGFTPLHLTVICTEQPLNWSWKNHDFNVDLLANFQSNESQKYLSRIESCLRYNPDVTSRDAQGSTPLHWAFRFQESYVVHRLLQRHETSSDYVDEYGLSHLHIACAAKNEALVEKLLLAGANVNQVATLGYTWLDVASMTPPHRSNMIHKFFINEGSTPLHFAVTVCCPKIVEILVKHEANVLAKDAAGLNPLERMLGKTIFVDDKTCIRKEYIHYGEKKLQIVELLVRKITSMLVDTKPNQLINCYSILYDNRLLGNICKHNDEPMMKLFEIWGITALHVACFTNDLSRVLSLAVTAEFDVNARVDLKSPLWPGYTPLHLITKYNPMDAAIDNSAINTTIVEILLGRGADVAAKNADGETPLYHYFHHNLNDLHLLLQHLKDFSVNPISRSGITHLHIASASGTVSIVEKLLEHGAEIDHAADYFNQKYGGYSALHFAVAHQRDETVDVLLKHGADANWINTHGENALHVAVSQDHGPSLELLRTLFDAGVDIHARNIDGDTPFESLIKSHDIIMSKGEMDFFLEIGSRVETFNPATGDGFLAVALYRQRFLPELQVFETFIQVPAVKDIDENGRNAVHNVVSYKRPSWDMLKLVGIGITYTRSGNYVRAIESLIKIGLNIHHQDFKGFTPLHVSARMQNLTGMIGLLENGADIDITDADGKTAFAYSLELAELHEERKELDLQILKVISTRILKLNLASIEVSKANKEVDKKNTRNSND